MRMHSYSKCSPNLVVGAVLIFSIIVLYNYWNISTLNRDLIIKINALEKQVISFSKANEGLTSGLDKVQDDKNKLQLSLQQEEMQGRDLRDRVTQKERLLKEVQSELETSKQDAQSCHDESTAREAKCQSKDKEISDLKEKITSLEAQVFEKTSIAEKSEGELSDAKSKIEDLQKELASKSTPASKLKSTSSDTANKPAPVAQPDEQDQPVLLNDPAESQMNPAAVQKPISKEPPVLDGNEPLKQPDKAGGEELEKDNGDMNANAKGGGGGGEVVESAALEKEGGGEKDSPADGVGVLAVPDSKKVEKFEKSENQQQAPQHAANLDAQEDDKDRQLKDDTQADDQSPDGLLPPNDVEKKEEKDKENVAPIPQVIKQQDLTANIPAPVGAHSGQDPRENAHLSNNL